MISRRSRRPRVLLPVLAGVILLVVGLWFGGHPSWLPSPLRSAFVDDNSSPLVNRVMSLIEHDYYRPVSRNQLVNKGLEGMVASLGDPYSHYYDATDYESFLSQSNPHLSGIGVDVHLDSRGLRVLDVFPGSPAADAGLTRGDVIISVGQVSLANRRDSNFGSRLIKGKPGTHVTLTILRGSHRQRVTLTRENLVVPVATGKVVTYHGIKLGSLALASFTDGSGAELKAQVEKVLHAGASGLILDLRDNPGGLLNEAVNVASIFIPDGTIVSTDGRAQPRQVYTAKGGAIAAKIPIVVLVDRGTASAAEIVTGALQDRGRAKVVGTRTYGKGVFQEIEPLPNGGALDFTVGEYFTPSGHNLGGGGVKEGAGVKPNIYVATTLGATPDKAFGLAERTLAAEVR